jgi:uncharacterized repeat protein (TIGR01451 family)
MRKKTFVSAMLTLALALCGGTALGATPPEAAGARGVDLDIRKTVHPGAVKVGEMQTFTVKVTNDGARRAEGVRMTDPLPSKVRFSSGRARAGAYRAVAAWTTGSWRAAWATCARAGRWP